MSLGMVAPSGARDSRLLWGICAAASSDILANLYFNPINKMGEIKGGLMFEEALTNLKTQPQIKLARAGWNGKGLFIQAQFPDENSKMGRPYLYISVPNHYQDGKLELVPWLPSQTDLFASDWYIVE
jgi:hypothetical protein